MFFDVSTKGFNWTDFCLNFSISKSSCHFGGFSPSLPLLLLLQLLLGPTVEDPSKDARDIPGGEEPLVIAFVVVHAALDVDVSIEVIDRDELAVVVTCPTSIVPPTTLETYGELHKLNI